MKKAPDSSAAQAALAQALTAAQGLRNAAAVATQRKLPAEGVLGASPATGPPAADEDSSENKDE